MRVSHRMKTSVQGILTEYECALLAFESAKEQYAAASEALRRRWEALADGESRLESDRASLDRAHDQVEAARIRVMRTRLELDEGLLARHRRTETTP